MRENNQIRNKRTKLLMALVLLLTCGGAQAQRFFNLTAQEVRIDSVLPQFSYSVDLDGNFADSVYTVSLLYPEYFPMSAGDIRKYNQITSDPLPATPAIEQNIVVERKKGKLEVLFVPLVMHEGKPQILVSFMLKVEAKALKRSMRRANARANAPAADRYASHSVLATGKWAKIRVPSSGIYQLTDALIRQAGFTDLSRVKVYGYGGALQNERLVAQELIETDDLKEVATYSTGGRRLFYAQGPIDWTGTTLTDVVLDDRNQKTSVNTNDVRVRNYFSDYGYYFITEGDGPLATDSTELVDKFYSSRDAYNTLYEVDGYAWYHGGRKLFDSHAINSGASHDVSLNARAAGKAQVTVVISSSGATSAKILLNGTEIGTMRTLAPNSYEFGAISSKLFSIDAVNAENTFTIQNTGTTPIRLDYIQITTEDAAAAPRLSAATFPVPEYVYNITNQDLHGDGFSDMVIVIPTSQKLLAQAQRLKAHHEEKDGLRVRIVPADELYNEFSSGTPDGNAYRRYLKMLYDRAETEADMPKYLLLFGDGAYDNRLISSEWQTTNYTADDILLCFESENSVNKVYCYTDDGWFCLLDDGEGANPQSSDKLDIAVGRFPVRTEEEAKVMVDKSIAYALNSDAGAWQNILMFLGDDGDGNIHMKDADAAAEDIASRYPGYQIKKVMWDAYTRETSSTGNSYPEVTKLIKEQQANGALIIDYAGHGSEISISHERVINIGDFQTFQNTHLPLWITASCDIMPFDHATSSIGEEAVLNKKGGAMAFFGTTRTVYANYNKVINMSYLKHVLSHENGKAITIGEAARRAKNEMITSGRDLTTNKLQYSLLGDPALRLNLPTLKVVIDSINGKAVSAADPAMLKAGSIAHVKGHIEEGGGKATDFNGRVSATVRDTEETISCKRNDPALVNSNTAAFTFKDRTKVLFNGSDSVRAGEFTFSFAVPMDINYADGTGLMNIYAVNDDHSKEAHGANADFIVGGSDVVGNDSIGPSIYCYLNSPSFTNGGNVNSAPYFVAQVTDKDGINASGTGIGHDMELIIDGDMSKTYILNDNFTFDFGSYTSGSTYYNIPALQEGRHQLKFRVWDILNNPSIAVLDFNVVRGLEPQLFSVSCTNNPASTNTTFIITHDRTGCDMDVIIDIFDMSGRLLWSHSESGVSTGSAYTVDWDLTVDGGRKLQTGVYIYRARISTDGSSMASKAKKLIILGNK